MAAPAGFDWLSYINQYPDLQAAGINNADAAYQHWAKYGQKENRTPPAQTVAGQPLGMVQAGDTFTNRAGTGLDAQGNLLPGWQYATYSNGVGQGTPINTSAAVNAYTPGSTGANLANLGVPNYAAAPNPYQQDMKQVAARTSGAATPGPVMPPPFTTQQTPQPNMAGGPQPWTPPKLGGGRELNFGIANSLWGHNNAQYRNRQLARLLSGW